VITVATWNVNSIRARLAHLETWLGATRPDVVGLQETKVQDHEFPIDALAALGYHCVYAGQKAYNGVAVLARSRLEAALTAIPGYPDPQRRVLAVDHPEFLFVDLYVPNGESVGSEKYAYKLAWLDALGDWIEGLVAESRELLVVGDFNIAPDDRDVHDPEAWAGKVLCSDDERARLRRLLGLGLSDV
jgi:exodeoxyribonuclease-3